MNLVHGQHPANMRLTSRVAVEPGARECSARLSARTLGLLRLCKLCFLWPIRVVPCGSNRYILGPSMRWAALSHVVNPIIWVSSAIGFVMNLSYYTKESFSFTVPKLIDAVMLSLLLYGTLWTTKSRTVYFCKYTQCVKELKDLNCSNEMIRKKFIITIVTICTDLLINTWALYNVISSYISSKTYFFIYTNACYYFMCFIRMAIRAPFYFCMSQLQMQSAELLQHMDKSTDSCKEIKDSLLWITRNMDKLQSLRNGARNIVKAFDFPIFCEIVILMTQIIFVLYSILYKINKNAWGGNYVEQSLYHLLYFLWLLLLIYLLVNPTHVFNENDSRITEKINESLLYVESLCRENEYPQVKEIWDRFEYMKLSPVRFRPFEVIDLDRGVYNTLIGVLSIYLVLLIQLEQ